MKKELGYTAVLFAVWVIGIAIVAFLAASFGGPILSTLKITKSYLDVITTDIVYTFVNIILAMFTYRLFTQAVRASRNDDERFRMSLAPVIWVRGFDHFHSDPGVDSGTVQSVLKIFNAGNGAAKNVTYRVTLHEVVNGAEDSHGYHPRLGVRRPGIEFMSSTPVAIPSGQRHKTKYLFPEPVDAQLFTMGAQFGDVGLRVTIDYEDMFGKKHQVVFDSRSGRASELVEVDKEGWSSSERRFEELVATGEI